jgi:hypothetical protein
LWCIPVIPALRRLRPKDPKFQANLGYIEGPSLRKKKSDMLSLAKIKDIKSNIKPLEVFNAKSTFDLTLEQMMILTFTLLPFP